MKVITLPQPHALCLALGLAQYIVRHDAPLYRGEIWIHASRRWDEDLALRVLHHFDLQPIFSAAGYATLGSVPRGKIIAVGKLTSIKRGDNLVYRNLGYVDRGLWLFRSGNVRAWKFEDVRPLEPAAQFPIQGEPGLWVWQPPASWQPRFAPQPEKVIDRETTDA